jgi:hypothetical protein
MDFIFGLPQATMRHASIFVVVDTMMKSAHFINMRTMYQAPGLAIIFISEIVRLHGVPRSLCLIEDLCLQDNFGLDSKRPWEPILTLVLHITRRQTGRTSKQTKHWRIFCVCTLWTNKSVGKSSFHW